MLAACSQRRNVGANVSDRSRRPIFLPPEWHSRAMFSFLCLLHDSFPEQVVMQPGQGIRGLTHVQCTNA
eukprot:scaffold208318_cov21-Prasinocladus_malaysianus.AAC.1